MKSFKRILGNERGQSTMEYIILLAGVVGVVFTANLGLQKIGLGEKLLAPITGDFAHTYQYGHPKANFDGQDPSSASMHPRITSSGNFRIFVNPRK